MHYIVLLLFGALSRFIPFVAAKVLTALGLGLFTMGTLMTLFATAKGYVEQHISYLPSAVYMLADTGGYLAGVTIIMAAMATRIGWLATQTVIKKI